MDGKRGSALVTGAAGGIGNAVARALRDAGFEVTGHDLRHTPGVDHALEGDLLGDPREVVRAAERAMGGLDVLVHCAGGGQASGLLDMTDAEWRGVVDLNLNVAFPLCQQAARGMVERAGGAIVLIGSICGDLAWRRYGHYCAAKAGLEMLGRSLAVELADRGLRCTTILPGTIDTPLNDRVTAGPDEAARLIARTPARRLGHPDEVAQLAVWLATAPAFVNGASFTIDGGYSVEGTP